MTARERPSRECYEEWTKFLVDAIVKLNGVIIETNKNQGIIHTSRSSEKGLNAVTPFVGGI